MTKSQTDSATDTPLHVAVIMDGNGRWAKSRGLPRHAGHAAGVNAVQRIVKAAPELGITTLSLYAFSADNWQRPQSEVSRLFSLLASYLQSETTRLANAGVRLQVFGRRDRLPPGIAEAIGNAEAATANGRALTLRVALDYSSRDAILKAATAAREMDDLTREDFSRLLANGEDTPDVDLLVRTSGEQRLSDFLLWECAYAELYFTPTFWPDFGAPQLAEAVRAFHTRQRRFGGLAQPDTTGVETHPDGTTATATTEKAKS